MKTTPAYGYNNQTQPDQYRSPSYLISRLVDITSKNGNYLLNIGPNGDGVVTQPIVDRLQAMGAWLKQAGDCIYGTVRSSPRCKQSQSQLQYRRFSVYRISFSLVPNTVVRYGSHAQVPLSASSHLTVRRGKLLRSVILLSHFYPMTPSLSSERVIRVGIFLGRVAMGTMLSRSLTLLST